MLRQTVVKEMVNNRNSLTRNLGVEWLRPSARAPIEGAGYPFGVAMPSARPVGLDSDGLANPGGPHDDHGPVWYQEDYIRYVWEPRVVCVSGRVTLPTGELSTVVTDQALVQFVAYSVWDPVKDTFVIGAAGDVLTTTTIQEPIGGVRSGIVGGREFYMSNSGEGYLFPRQVPANDNKCGKKVNKYWALVMAWNLEADHIGHYVIEWDWVLQER